MSLNSVIQPVPTYKLANLSLISGVNASKNSRMFMKEIKQSVFVSGVFTSQSDTVASQYDPAGRNPISVVYFKEI